VRGVFIRETEIVVSPQDTIQNLQDFLKFVVEQGWSDDELYFVVKLIQEMFVLT
jgi:hypothetical protein